MMAATSRRSKAGGRAKRKDSGKRAPVAGSRPARRKGLSFGFLIFVFIFLAGIGVFMLVQRQYAVTCDIKVRKVQAQTDSEKSKQESLRLSIAKLKSPGRIARIASDELGLGDPTGVIYLKYAWDPSGKMVCASTFEQHLRPAVVTDKPADQQQEQDTGKTQASIVEGPGGTLTRR
jgi:cell division protein FtsL